MYLAILAMKWFAISTSFYPLDIIITPGFVRPFQKQIINCGCLVIQIFFAVVAGVINSDGLRSNSMMWSPWPLSGRIEIFLLYMSSILPGLISRVASVVYRRDIASFFENLLVSSGKSIKIEKQKKLFLTITSTSLYAVWFVGSAVTGAQMEIEAVNWYKNCSVALLPCSQIIVRIVFTFCDIWELLSVLYALVFIAIAGLAVVDSLDVYSLKCKSVIQELIGKRSQRKNGNTDMNYDALVQEYRRIRTNFELYSKIGGPYALALTAHFVLVCIGFLSYFLAGNASDDWFRYPLRWYIVVSLPCAFSMFYFAHYVADSVRLISLMSFDVELLMP